MQIFFKSFLFASTIIIALFAALTSFVIWKSGKGDEDPEDILLTRGFSLFMAFLSIMVFLFAFAILFLAE